MLRFDHLTFLNSLKDDLFTPVLGRFLLVLTYVITFLDPSAGAVVLQAFHALDMEPLKMVFSCHRQ